MNLRKSVIGGIIAGTIVGASGGIAAYAATQGSGFQQIACVEHGQAGSAAGNFMEYDWNDSLCPVGTYEVHLAPLTDSDSPAPTVTVTVTPSVSPSVSPSATATH